jgi:hypothetical protein
MTPINMQSLLDESNPERLLRYLRLRDLRQYAYEDIPELLEQVFELADLIVRACLDFSLEVPTNQAGRRHNDLLQAFENESVEEHQHEKNAGRKRYDRYRQKNILCFPHRDDRRVAQV